MSRRVDRRRSYCVWTGWGAMAALVAGCMLSFQGAAQTAGRTGKELFEKRCSGCHALDKDKEGPRLAGIYGREAGSIASFDYSAALKKSKIKWTDESLNKWLIDPEKLVPENDMAFHVESADERREIIAYLKQKSAK
jgi:cytochrome c